MTNTPIASHWAKSVGWGNAAARPAAPRQPATNATASVASHAPRIPLTILTLARLGCPERVCPQDRPAVRPEPYGLILGRIERSARRGGEVHSACERPCTS